MTQQTICLIVFVVTLIGYISNKWPLALVSMTSFFVLTITGCLSASDALGCFSNSSAIIMACMFIVAAGLNRTQMIHKVTNLVYKVSGGSFIAGMAGYCLVTVLIAQVAPSAILIFTICYPLVVDFCRKMGKSPSKGLFSIALISIVSVVAFPIGSGATSYIANNELFATYGLAYKSHMFDPFLVRLPSIVMAYICGVFICPRFCPDYGPLEGGADQQNQQKKTVEKKPLDPVREVLGYGIFLAVVVGILLASYIGIPTWQICFAGAVLEILTGVLSEKEAMSALSLPPIFLYVGSLGLGNALVNTGAGDLIASLVTKMIGNDPSPVFVYALFWIVGFVMTQMMSNLALYSALTPVVLLTCASLGWNPIGLLSMVFTACWTSYLTPLSTVCVPFLMEVGGYKQKDLLKAGWLPALLITAVMIPWTLLMFPPF
ncbi:SLC13 family permease [Lutispora saccharofermentans]|uniref:Citrate transporter-like domain-containing protein n=1 Tax=Lutispora saccharofermentans TaxID=3024236 RepID=A0ABT1NDH8_9FIRM|nr:SLC13 family permease [Lutispora saccharofermentans]MCQ1529297.1 hypothetical protein [Lutispora saccharofermentans]